MPDLLPGEADEVAPKEEKEGVGTVRVTDREFVVYHPHHGLSDRDIDQFLIIAR